MDLSLLLKRKQLVVNPKLQFGVIFFFVGLSMLNVIFFILVSQFTQNSTLESISMLDEAAQKTMLTSFSRQSNAIFQASLIFSIFNIGLALAFGLILLNHVAGPIYAMKKYLEEILNGGSPAPLKFRKYDFFSDISELINQVVDKLKK